MNFTRTSDKMQRWNTTMRTRWKKIFCVRWLILWKRIKKILTSASNEQRLKTPLLSLIEACVSSNHACAHIQKLKLGFCSPFAFKFADKVREYRWNPDLSFSCVSGHIRATFRERERGGRERKRERERGVEETNILKKDECELGVERKRARWEKLGKTERKRAEGRREIGADGTDGRGRAANEMRLGRSPAKTKCINCSRVSWWCEGKLLYVCLREA